MDDVGPRAHDAARPVRVERFRRQLTRCRYLPAALAARAVPAWTPTLCSPAGLRSINVLVLLLLPFVYASLLATIRSRLSKTALSNNIVRLEALSISCFPLVFFFGGLFYTDLGGLLLMLGSYRLALGGCHSSSALVSPPYRDVG